MRNFRFLAVCGILLGLLAGTTSAFAHSDAPLRTITARGGPYELDISYYNEPRGGAPLVFSVAPESALNGPMRYTITAIPGTTVEAVPVKATLEDDADRPGGVWGQVNLPVSGQWLLSIEINGPLGPAQLDAPIVASAPSAIPVWLGWLIGLLPVWAMIGYILAQTRRPQLATA